MTAITGAQVIQAGQVYWQSTVPAGCQLSLGDLRMILSVFEGA